MVPHDRLGPQLPLALRYPPQQRFETWLGDPTLASRLHAWTCQDAGEALYLQGPPGSGKTHLAMASCAHAEALGRQPAYLSLASVAGRLADAGQGLEQADLVVLDAVDAVAGHAADELALFDLHNRVRDAGKDLLYAARLGPAALPVQLPDLRSRLAQCTLLALPAPDDAGRAAVLRQRAQACGLVLEDAALDWMLTRTGRDLGGLVALLERLDRASLAAQRRVTVPFLRQVLAG